MQHSSIHSELDKAITYKQIDISSAAFKENDLIPVRYTCDGKNVNPSLNFDHIPKEAQCLAIIVDDPDAPSGTWAHWVIWNIPVTHHLKEDHPHGTEGLNDFKKNRYDGPCPPKGTHRYFFKVYALDSLLDIPKNSNKEKLEKAMAGHILGFGELIGLYKKE